MSLRKSLPLIAVVLLALAACESRTDKTDGGGVVLSVSDFDGLPVRIGVNASGLLVQVGEITVDNVAKDPNGVTSSLMNVEIHSYEVAYTRADSGRRVPPRFVAGLFGVAPVDGSFDVRNLPVMGADQFLTEPLSDLFFQNGGFDKETGNPLISLNFQLRFFGRTLSGDAVESAPANFKVEFVP